jgi:hypothetical protein
MNIELKSRLHGQSPKRTSCQKDSGIENCDSQNPILVFFFSLLDRSSIHAIEKGK